MKNTKEPNEEVHPLPEEFRFWRSKPSPEPDENSEDATIEEAINDTPEIRKPVEREPHIISDEAWFRKFKSGSNESSDETDSEEINEEHPVPDKFRYWRTKAPSGSTESGKDTETGEDDDIVVRKHVGRKPHYVSAETNSSEELYNAEKPTHPVSTVKTCLNFENRGALNMKNIIANPSVLEDLNAAISNLNFKKLISDKDTKRLRKLIYSVKNDLAESKKRSSFRVTCAGIYNSGKSTLLNALTGGEHFKVGDVPTTAAIDEFDCDGVTYVDTPGLNANDFDNETAQKAFKQANVIIFVSNMISGGLTSAEADYLKELSEILGGVNNLQKQVIFAMSNLHQLDDNAAEKVVKEHRKNIKSVLGFDPKNIIVYDAVTYENGKREGSDDLIEASGIDELKSAISKAVENVSEQSDSIFEERISAKIVEIVNALKSAVEPIEKRVERLSQMEQKSVDPQAVEAAIEECKKIIDKAKSNWQVPQFRCSEISGRDLQHKSTFVRGCNSRSDCQWQIRQLVEKAYENRKDVLVDKGFEFADMLGEYASGIFGNKYLETVNEAVIICGETMKQSGVIISTELVKPLNITLPTVKFDRLEVRCEVTEDCYHCGSPYTLHEYLDNYCDDIDEFEHYAGRGAFGRDKYKKEYSCDCSKAISEMAKDMNGQFVKNCHKVWNKFFGDKNDFGGFFSNIKHELEQRLSQIIGEANEACKGSCEDELSKLQEAINSIKKFL